MADPGAHVLLRPRIEKYLRRGYPWIFSNQIARIEGSPGRGEVVSIVDSEGRLYGRGLYNDRSLIAVRFLTRTHDRPIDRAFFEERLDRALRLRNPWSDASTPVRLVYSESDGLPGTIVDKYGDVLTWSCICLGMERYRDTILDILEERISPRAVVERNDSWLRDKEGLPESKGILRGTFEGTIEVREGPVRYRVDPLEGPKTGLFIDQRLHREVIGRLARDRTVLDVCCADGGFGLHALAGGARSVHFLDTSEAALERVRTNMALNGFDAPAELDAADALDRLESLHAEGQRFDLIVLDPPAFAKSKRHLEAATRAYQRLNINALQLLSPGGMLATSSCSQALDEKVFLKIIHYGAQRTGVSLRLLYRGTQPPDHPVLESMPETAYLKFFIFQLLDDELPGPGVQAS